MIYRFLSALTITFAVTLICQQQLQAADCETFSYFRNGVMATDSVATLKQQEEWSSQGGHQPWRKDPVMVAAVMTAILLPDLQPGETTRWETKTIEGQSTLVVTAPSWEAVYTLFEEADRSSAVILRAKGNPSYRIELQRPFGYGWYVTAVVVVEWADAEIRTCHKSDRVVAMRPLLESHGFKVSWSQSDVTATAESGSVKLVVKPGSKSAEFGGNKQSLSAASALVDSEMMIPYGIISMAITEDAKQHIAGVSM